MTTRATTPPPAVPLTFAAVRERIQRPRRTVSLVLDAEAAARIDALGELLERSDRHGHLTPEETARIAGELREAEEQAEASLVPFTLQAISHRRYQQLRGEHPPTRHQLDQARQAGEAPPAFDPDSFAPALVHAQLTDPAPADAEEFGGFWDELSDGQLARLWSAALAVQLQAADLTPRSRTAAELLAATGRRE